MRIILESPFRASDTATEADHAEYARRCMRHSESLGEAPFATHVLWALSGTLNDADPEQRARGMAAGQAWYGAAQGVVCYVDYGVSGGMEAGLAKCRELGIPELEPRRIGRNMNKHLPPIRMSLRTTARDRDMLAIIKAMQDRPDAAYSSKDFGGTQGIRDTLAMLHRRGFIDRVTKVHNLYLYRLTKAGRDWKP